MYVYMCIPFISTVTYSGYSTCYMATVVIGYSKYLGFRKEKIYVLRYII